MHLTSIYIRSFALLFSLIVSLAAWAQDETYGVKYLTIDEGLPQNEVTAILQDRKGFIWFGTRGGLARYDGYRFRVFQYEPGNHNTLSNNSIETLFEDRHGNIWIGTKSGGLNYFNPVLETFRNYQSDPDDTTTISGNRIVSIAEDGEGKLWVGTWGNGLNCLDPSTGKFRRSMGNFTVLALKYTSAGTLWISAGSMLYKMDPSVGVPSRVYLAGFNYFDITSISVDEKRSLLWLGGWEKGLVKYDFEKDAIVSHYVQQQQSSSIGSNNIYTVLRDTDGQLWLGSWGEGLEVMHPSEEKFSKITIAPHSVGEYTTDYDIILSILQDRSGVIWIGTDGGGICKIERKNHLFRSFTNQNSALSNRHILSLVEDAKGNVWIGTKGGGLNELNSGKIIHHKEIYETIPDYNINVVHTLYRDRRNDLWFGTNHGLHKIVSTEGGRIRFRTFTPDPRRPGSLSGRKVMAILEDSKGNFWVGTQQTGLNRLLRFDRNGDPVFKVYRADPQATHGLLEDRISALFEDSKGRIWIGTYKGLHLYREDIDGFVKIHHQPGGKNTLSNDIINCIAEDKAGNIWVGTSGGLNLVQYEHGVLKARYYVKKDGLPNDYINALLVDGRQQLWLSTNGGIYRFDPDTGKIIVYGVSDGLQSNAFSEGAAYKSIRGEMYFGGINGFNVFHPDYMPEDTTRSPLALVSLKIMNKEVNPGDTVHDEVILTKSITYTDAITLSYLDRIFSIEVSSLDYTVPEKNQYTFKLEGFDENWVNTGNTKTVTYTNLKAGHYTLCIRASNGGNVWVGETIRLAIHVLEPPWKTGWAYLCYAIAGFAIIAVIVRIGVRQMRLKTQLRLAKIIREKTELQQRKEKEITEVKFRFFTNVSHELRTPLTLIASPLEEILTFKNLPANLREKLLLMHRHTSRLTTLVNQLLDLRKSETGNMQLVAERSDMIGFVSGIFHSFSDIAARRRIDYVLEHEVEELMLEFDKNKMEMALTNILSNAFKYTPDGGSISCMVSVRKNAGTGDASCLIRVEDTGKGIPQEALDKIFDLYYQVATIESVKITGTGIGLALVKEIVQLHGGGIEVESVLGEGSVFTVSLPVVSTELNNSNAPARAKAPAPAAHVEVVTAENIQEVRNKREKPILLIIEDTDDLRNYLIQLLHNDYYILQASSGEEGLSLALEKIPDIVISDVMMDKMDGFELCHQLKTNEKTSHIPVILLTAKTMPENELIGLVTGADDYIKKPFHPSVLKARIQRLFESRKQLKEYYSRKVTLQPTNIEITPYDEKFLQKAMELVENNVMNPQLNTQLLSSELNMSHSTLYRKLKALTGLSINEFIRSIRLKRAAQLLASGELTVSEVAFQTGFTEMKYFRTYFKEQFGCLPSEYEKNTLLK